MPIDQHRAAEGEHDLLPLVADVDIGRPGDELLDLALAPGDSRQPQPIRVRMFFDTQHLGDEDLVAVPNRPALLRLDAHVVRCRQAENAHAADFQTGQRHALDELGRRQGERDVIAEPVEGNFHGKLWVPVSLT
jgi:hypothetical protein